MKGAKGVLINITGGNDITLFEVDEAANRIRDEVESDAHIIFGSCFDETMEGKIRVSVVATGIDSEAGIQPRPMAARTETRAVGRRLPAEVRTPAPTARAPVTAAAPAAPAVERAPAPVQPSFTQFGFGGPTLAPAHGAMDLQAEERALMEMTAAVRKEVEAEVEAEMPVVASQAAAVAEAIAAAPAAAPPRTIAAMVAPVMPTAPMMAPMPSNVFGGAPIARDVFVARAPVEPRQPEFRMEPMPEPKPAPVAEPAPVATAPAPAPRIDPARVSPFGRYRSLTTRKPEDAPKAPEPQAKVEKAGSLNISVGPQDRPLSSRDEDELEIPAFLRRQAN